MNTRLPAELTSALSNQTNCLNGLTFWSPSAAILFLSPCTNHHPAAPTMLRIYADFNSCDENGYYWCLRYDGRPLADVAKEPDLHPGQAVVLFYDDAEEEFEFDAILQYADGFWLAMTDETTYRKIRG